MNQPKGAVIEIIEKRRSRLGGLGGEVIVPDEIRINGQSLLLPADSSVKVHEIDIPSCDAVLVTLTVFARRVVIDAEEPEETRA